MTIRSPKDRKSVKEARERAITDAAIEIWEGTELFGARIEHTWGVDGDNEQVVAFSHALMVCDDCLEPALVLNAPKGRKCFMTPGCPGTFWRHSSLMGTRRPTFSQAAKKGLPLRRLSDRVTLTEIEKG